MAPHLCGFVCGFHPTNSVYDGLRHLRKSYDDPRMVYGFQRIGRFHEVLPKLKIAGSRPVTRFEESLGVAGAFAFSRTSGLVLPGAAAYPCPPLTRSPPWSAAESRVWLKGRRAWTRNA